MKTVNLYTLDGCEGCIKAKAEIRKRKSEGKLCYNFKIKDVNKLPNDKLPKKLDEVPMAEVDGKLIDFWDLMNKCK